METILNVLPIVSAISPIVSVIVTVITAILMIPDAIRAIQELKNRKAEKPSFVSLRKSPTKNAVQYIAKRNWLILRAKQEAEKRPKATYVNLRSILIITLILCLWAWLWNFPLLPLIEKISDCLPVFLSVFNVIYEVVLVAAFVAYIAQILLMPFNVSNWPDLIKKGRYNFVNKSEKGARREAKRIGKEKIKGAKKISKEAAKEAKKAKKEAVKEAKKNEYYVHISRVIDIASHFDTYLLLDADPCDTDSRDAFLEDKVIGATKINKDESVCDKIESCLKEKPDEKLVVFIYSRHGKASYEQTKKARNECKYKYVYDLGPVCGDMRDLEIVAHQLLYLKDKGCLKLPY